MLDFKFLDYCNSVLNTVVLQVLQVRTHVELDIKVSSASRRTLEKEGRQPSSPWHRDYNLR